MASWFRPGAAAAYPGDHLLIAIAEQPGLTAAMMDRLVARHRSGRATASAYGDHGARLSRSHPLLIDAGIRTAASRQPRATPWQEHSSDPTPSGFTWWTAGMNPLVRIWTPVTCCTCWRNSGAARTRLWASKPRRPGTPASSPAFWRGESSTRYSCILARNSLYWYQNYSSSRMPLRTAT
jgi:hypothetical protein